MEKRNLVIIMAKETYLRFIKQVSSIGYKAFKWTNGVFICVEYCDVEDYSLNHKIENFLQETDESSYLYLNCLSDYVGNINSETIIKTKGKLDVKYQVRMDLHIPGYKMVNL
ncbi:hypothetical protein BSP4_43520 [Bacillus subtilis subsp. subtilis]|uniref:hypothetical protein n=1 Tax=Bacillus subtilis TaxID=1423 RepID=UPI000C78DE4D|nr:hypothetical protein [Bacillus subtilis]PLV31813.1 hypothetical protein BSP4_43520 [Bacillus subtilis subsp. subtilis]